MWINRQPQTGVYHIQDDIKSLTVRIRLQSVTSPLLLPQYIIKKERRSLDWGLQLINNDEKILPSAEGTATILAEETIRWQQKLLSGHEIAQYRDANNCQTPIQELYHKYLEEVIPKKDHTKKDMKDNHKSNLRKCKDGSIIGLGNKIYTYINADNHEPEGTEIHPQREDKDNRDIDHNCNKNYPWLPEKSRRLHKKNPPMTENMYVYASLDVDILLAVLMWLPKAQLLYVYPDFMDFRGEYHLLEIRTDYRHIYTFGMENITTKKQRKIKQTQQYMNMDWMDFSWKCNLNKTHPDFMNDQFATTTTTTTTFTMPPKRTQRCLLLFEIQNYVGFEYDNCHIRFTIKSPSYTTYEDGLVDGNTHSVRHASAIPTIYTNIGYCWQLLIRCEELFNGTQPLRIFFEVISIDYWGRERLEGYGYHCINLTQPNDHRIIVNCIRPIENLWESVCRFFIGGRRKFDHIAFFQASSPQSLSDTTDKNDDSNQDSPIERNNVNILHSHYGQRFQYTGHLNVRYQLIVQRTPDLLDNSRADHRTSNRLRRSTTTPLTHTSMNMDDIMSAYRKARIRLEKTTKIKTQ